MADSTIESVTFYEPAIVYVHGIAVNLKLKFEKGNVHPQIFKKMTEAPPGIPFQDTYDMLVKYKKSLKSLPKEARKHWKPGYLILTDIPNNSHMMNDANLLWSIMQQRFPGCMLVTNVVKNWTMKDLLSLLSFRAATPNLAPPPTSP